MDECKPLLHGRFGMEAHSMHACRPVGPAMTLTAAMEGVVIDLDGRPAGRGRPASPSDRAHIKPLVPETA